MAQGDYDWRTQAQRTLNNLLDVYEKLSTKAFSSIASEGNVWSEKNIRDLIMAINYARAQVSEEQARTRSAEGKGTGRRILVRFPSP